MIVLHGRGDRGEGFHWLPEALGINSLNYLFLDAPYPYGPGQSWYDPPPRQGPGILHSRQILNRLLDTLQRECGVEAKDIFLFGFSQGCLMSIDVALRYPQRLGGIIGVSGYVFFEEEYPAQLAACARQQKFLITHGYQDDMLDIARTRDSIARLQAMGLAIDWREFNKAHTIDPDDEIPCLQMRLQFWLESN